MARKLKLDKFDDAGMTEMVEDCIRSATRALGRNRLQTASDNAMLHTLIDVNTVTLAVLCKIMQKVTPQVLERIERPIGAIDEADPIHLVDPNS